MNCGLIGPSLQDSDWSVGAEFGIAVAQRGDALYESEVRAQVEEGNHGKIVAIDIETGAFELADDTIAATDRLYERVPDAQPWVIRIGHRTVHKSLDIKIIRSNRL
jgi:hypothetical protein